VDVANRKKRFASRKETGQLKEDRSITRCEKKNIAAIVRKSPIGAGLFHHLCTYLWIDPKINERSCHHFKMRCSTLKKHA
jgi:hypothetical protein